jgi:imidazolonepropionase-like amidohydrolase
MILHRSRFLSLVLAICAVVCNSCPSLSLAQETETTQTEVAPAEAKSEKPQENTEKPAEENKSKDEKPAPEPPKPTLAIVNATIHPVGSAPISNGKLLIAGDSIVGIGGADLVVPDGIEVIDAAGLNLTPGWIDVSSQLWMSPAVSPPVNNFGNFNNFGRNFNNNFNENPAPTTSNDGISDGSLKAVDGLDPFSEDWKDVIAAGVTTVYVQPSSQNPMGGLGATISVVPDSMGKLIVHNSASGLQMSLGRFASNRDRAARFEALKNGLQAIADYKKKWDDYEEAVKKAEKDAAAGNTQPTEARREGESSNAERPTSGSGQGNPERRGGGFRREGFGGGREGQDGRGGFSGRPRPEGQMPTSGNDARTATQPATTPPTKPKKPDVDVLKQRLLGVLNGEIPIRLEVHNSNDAHYAMELQKQFPKANWILEDVDQLSSALGSIRESRLPVVVGSWLQFSRLDSTFEKRMQSLKELIHGSDSVIGISSNSVSGNGSQYLREQLALACAAGLSKEKALSAVTYDAAKLIGCDKKIGMLAPGYRADIVGFSGDPLDTSVPVSLVICGGKVVVKSTPPANAVATVPLQASALPTVLPKKFQLHSSQVLLADGFKDVTLTIDDGKVIAMEEGLKANGTDPLIEIGSQIVTPGLQSVHTTLGLDPLLRGVDSNSAHLSPSDLTALDFSSRKAIEKSGLHSVALATGSTNTLPGQISWFTLSGDGAPIVSALGSKIVLSSEARTAERFPSSLAGQVKFVRDALSMKMEPSLLFVPEKTIEFLNTQKQAVMKQLLEQKQVALFWVSNDAEVVAALQIIEQFKLKAAIAGYRNLASYADRLKGLNVSVIALPLSEADFPQYFAEIATCHSKGVAVYFAGDHGDQIRLSAAKAVQAGVSKDWALQAVTSGVQKLYGTQASGGLNVGNEADFIVWSGNPLDLTSRPVLQMCGGEVITEEDKP